MRANIVLVDWESVQPESFDLLTPAYFKVTRKRDGEMMNTFVDGLAIATAITPQAAPPKAADPQPFDATATTLQGGSRQNQS